MTSKDIYIFIDIRHFERSTLKETLLDQANSLILPVVNAFEGDEEAEIVRHLFRLRKTLSEDAQDKAWEIQVDANRAGGVKVVNSLFQDRLMNLPTDQHIWNGSMATDR